MDEVCINGHVKTLYMTPSGLFVVRVPKSVAKIDTYNIVFFI